MEKKNIVLIEKKEQSTGDSSPKYLEKIGSPNSSIISHENIAKIPNVVDDLIEKFKIDIN